jgi:hypothetical protein
LMYSARRNAPTIWLIRLCRSFNLKRKCSSSGSPPLLSREWIFARTREVRLDK